MNDPTDPALGLSFARACGAAIAVQAAGTEIVLRALLFDNPSVAVLAAGAALAGALAGLVMVVMVGGPLWLLARPHGR